MASLIPGYEYDIFISYRQKDNKYDGWVTEFVDNLKKELEATFKEEISVYFDINPHDGLLETHDVDASLKEKLKCLIFIPIISRTYCDPKSFAWEHEFKAFVDQATNDKLGLKVNLAGGNVTTRVLPVCIHYLDDTDIRLCEKLLGGMIRGIDFIYKSAGVNRPLRANEDHPKDNLNKTYYRDQINKLANAIDDIINTLSHGKSITEDKASESQIAGLKKNSTIYKRISNTLSDHNFKKRFMVFVSSVLVMFASVLIYKFIYLPSAGRTIAVLPFFVENNDSTLSANGDTLMVDIYNKLRKVKGLTVRSLTSSLQYRNTRKPVNIIRKELKANYLAAGSMEPGSSTVKVSFELIKAKRNKPLLFEKYTRKSNQIHQLGTEIVQTITSGLNTNRSGKGNMELKEIPTKNTYAHLNYMSGNFITDDARFYFYYGNKLLDSTSFQLAISKYDEAIKMDSLFALAYAMRGIARSWGYHSGQLDSTEIDKCRQDIDSALKIDKELNEAQIASGFYYYYCKYDYENALKYFQIAVDREPQNYQPLFFMAIVYRKMDDWQMSQHLMNMVIKLDPQEALFLTNIGLSFTYLHKYDSALIYHQKAIDNMPRWSLPYKNIIESFILKSGNAVDAKNVLETAVRKTGENFLEFRILINIYENRYEEALDLAIHSEHNDFKINGGKYIYLAWLNDLLNNPGNAKNYYDSALVVLKHDLINYPASANIHSSAGIAYAGIGNKEKAVEEGELAVALASTDNLNKSNIVINLARIYTMVGEYDNALINIEYLLNNPSCFSIKLLQIDPVWNPLNNLPEFQTLIKNYSRI